MCATHHAGMTGRVALYAFSPMNRCKVYRCLSLMLVGAFAVGCGTSPEFMDDVATPVEVVRVRPATESRDVDPLAGLVGRWTGVGHQSDGSSWAMEVDVTRLEDGPCALVHYPSLGCSGYWECFHSAGRRLRAVERITDGKGICVDDVRVDLKLGRDRQTAAFTARTGDVSAAGKLERSLTR